jgi:PAS domain S-box-containing protein
VETDLDHWQDASTNSATAKGGARSARLLVTAWGSVLTLYLLIVSTGLVGGSAARAINDIAWTIAAALATFSSVRAARSLTGRERAAWFTFALASAAWTAGQLVWDYYELGRSVIVPFPSYADIGYSAFGCLMTVGVLMLRTTQHERRMSWLRLSNLGLILCSLAVVMITMLSQPFGEARGPLASSLVIVAETGALVLAFVVAVYCLWSYEWKARLLAFSLLTLSLAVQMILAVLYTRQLVTADYGAMSSFNIGWILSFAIHQCAAEAQVSVNRENRNALIALQETQGWVEAVIPGFLVLCVAISAACVADEITTRTVQLASVALSVFALLLAIREGWLHSQGQRLRGQLDNAKVAVTRARGQLKEIDVHRRELERILEVTARAGGVGLWDWNLSTDELRFSDEWKRQLGFAQHEIADDMAEFDRRLHPDDRARVNDAIASYLRNPQGEFALEMRLQHRDGSYRWILTRGHLALDDAGRPMRFLGAHVDITAFKQLELSLRESEARQKELAEVLEHRVAERTSELTEAFRESQNFSYAVAHDLKAPLRAMNGFSALLQQSATQRLNDEERDYVNRVRQGALQMEALIDGLLAYSRIEHREQRLQEVDCKEIVDETLLSMTDAIHGSSAEVTVNVERTPVVADREGLLVVLRNLMDNALKFSWERRPPRIDIAGQRDHGRYILQVSDNGIGFDAAYREKIFDIFNRLHASGYEGTGIGLSLVRKAVQRMRGQVWAESELGRGATFCVSLPLAAGAPRAQHDDTGFSES